MLSQALQPLKTDIENALNSPETAKAFEVALLTTFGPDSVDEEDFKKVAEMFGKVAAKKLSKSLSGPIGDAIDKYVKQIGLLITPSDLTTALGPVAGVINPTDVQVL